VQLPDNESFTVEYVTNKPWSGYNWYQGNYRSLIQVNTDLPIYIDRAIDLACHEGYPGHHVYNALLEKHLVRDRGWVEFTVYPLFSPQSLIAEGTANYGIEVAFPGNEREAFEHDVLYPEGGLDPAQAPAYARVQTLVDRLAYAGNEAARKYLNGAFDRKQATAWMAQYAMMPPVRAEQRTRFFDTYRSYVINYNLGKDLVKQLRRVEGRRRRAAGETLGRVRPPARVAASAFRPADAGRSAALMAQTLPLPGVELPARFGEIDVYLFDQLLRGRFDRRPRVLDAGCGDGRNLIYLLRRGFTCFGIDRDPAAIAQVQAFAAQLAPDLPRQNFRTGELDELPWDSAVMDAVVCSAVLHFAADLAHFDRMVQELWRVLAPDGMLFARLASNIGLENLVGAGRRRVRLPDGSDRFVVDEALLIERTQQLGGQLLDPIKTTNVQGQRCMTTWVVRRHSPSSSPTPLKSST